MNTTVTGPDNGQQARDLALAEYKQIKNEQAARISTRDNLIYVTLVAIAGALTIAHSAHSPGYLLLVPPVASTLGWTYLCNDHMITAIGRYVRQHPALTAMRWESDHPADRRRAVRKTIQLAVDLATFCGSALAALTTFWLAPASHPPLLTAASVIEAAATGALACQFTAYADIPLTRALRGLSLAALARRAAARSRTAGACAGPAAEIISFGYGHGPAPRAHAVIDVRAHFRDPHADPGLRGLTAADPRVTGAVLATPGIPELIAAVTALVRAYGRGPQPAAVTVAVGCAGGRHRSAVIAAEAARQLRRSGIPATVTHRDMHRPVLTRTETR